MEEQDPVQSRRMGLKNLNVDSESRKKKSREHKNRPAHPGQEVVSPELGEIGIWVLQ